MKTFKIENGDLVIDKSRNILMVEGKDELRQSIERILTTKLNEYFLNIELGLDYDAITGKGITKNDVEIAIRDAVFQEERVDDIDFINISFDDRNRKLYIKFDIIIDNENIEGIEVIL